MPIEREFKYILRDSVKLWDHILTLPESNFTGRATISQGYLSKGGRIRKRDWVFHSDSTKPKVELIFTYKCDLTKQPGCLEIETPISEEDFDLAWDEADHKISKTRYLLPCDMNNGTWEIDFFFDEQGCYLALAEFEVPATAGPPDRLPPIITDNLLYIVPEGDGRFKNRKLCERKKVKELLKEIA